MLLTKLLFGLFGVVHLRRAIPGSEKLHPPKRMSARRRADLEEWGRITGRTHRGIEEEVYAFKKFEEERDRSNRRARAYLEFVGPALAEAGAPIPYDGGSVEWFRNWVENEFHGEPLYTGGYDFKASCYWGSPGSLDCFADRAPLSVLRWFQRLANVEVKELANVQVVVTCLWQSSYWRDSNRTGQSNTRLILWEIKVVNDKFDYVLGYWPA